MFSQKVIVWGGIASAFGGFLWFSGMFTTVGGDSTFPLGLLLMLAGLAVLHARQRKQAGALGWVGLVLGVFGTGLFLASLVWQWLTGNFINPTSGLGLLVGLGIPLLGIGSILIGLRTLQIGILPRSSGILSFVVGACQIGLAISVWLGYSTTSDPYQPMTIYAWAILFFVFSIGTLWMALGAVIAGDGAGLQTPNRPPASV